MAAARYSSEVLQAMMEENLREFQRNPQRNNMFLVTRNDFNDWLRVWKMNIPEADRNNKDLYTFARKNKKKFYDLLVSEINDLQSLKASFGLEVKFSIQRDGETQEMEHYFKEKEPHVFNEHNKQQIKQEFDRFIERAKGQIEAWSERGSGWVIERITEAYVNVARYQPLRGGTYLPLPADLAKKKAIINVQNRDNECLKWALRAALFPPRDGKNPQRTSKYPVNDVINYEGILFPTPVKQLDKLEAQNKNLAINVFGWEDNCVIVHRISEKERKIPRICLILIESGLIQHYCFVKKVSALLYDQNKHQHKKHFCMMCLTGFSTADLLENHEKYCNGVNGRPTRIEMPKNGENTLSFQNYHKQMKVPYVIYADFEALVRKMQRCERETLKDRQKRKDIGEELEDLKQKSYTEKTEQHEACGFSYTVVRSDGINKPPVTYRDVFENFRKICLEKYGLDPANYYTSPGLSWDALLKKTGVQLELLTDYDMHLFVERGIRGGISMVSKRYAKANNPYVEGYDEKNPKKYLMYLDANNLYGWAMSKPLPKSGFRWKRVMPTEKEIMRKKEFAKTGWILEVDFEYPAELHEEHNSYPLAPEKKKINKDLFSPYQKELIKNLDLDPPDSEKLVLTLEDKTNYVVHYRNLQFYLKQGMKLKKVHRVLEFEQECWMEPYIKMNTEFRKKAKNDFEKNFYKLMNNSVFGKTMENLRNRVDIKIARSDETNKIRKLVASPLYSRHVLFSNDLVGIDMRKSRLFLNKPVYTGMTILDVSKILMYDFFYNEMKMEYGQRCELLYTDTDSLLLEIETEDIYEDIYQNKTLYDTSDYPKEHSLHSYENKKVLGKMKDECAGTPISECVCLRPKMYSILTEDQKKIKLKFSFNEP
ncbi:hypothetical protein ACROYT_G002373 [Oculina patagonica]